MASSVVMILALTAIFLAAVLNLAVDSRFRKGLNRFSLIFAGITGIFFYGYGYVWNQGLTLISMIRALLAVSRVFAGGNDLDSIRSAPLFQNPVILSIFWLAHFLAFYAVASTAIAAVGQRVLRTLRVTRLRRGPLLLVYGISARSVEYGRHRAKEDRYSVVFVDEEYNSVFDSAISAFGGLVEKSSDALAGNTKFLKHLNIRPGKRRLEVAALKADGRENLNYTRALLAAMTEAGIRPEQTTLIAEGVGAEAADLQALGGEGYGNVHAFDETALTARRAIREHPPCELVEFDETGRATGNLQTVIVGFGATGRAMLSQMIMNGQFTGSHFRADIFDPAPLNGFLLHRPLTERYDIRFHDQSGDSAAFYAFLEENLPDIRLIILCTENGEKNLRTAEDLRAWFPRGGKNPPILMATREEYRWIDAEGHEQQSEEGTDIPDFDELDAMAIQINQIYCEEAGSRASAKENWQKCSYFDRESNRACADFYPAVLRAAGKTEEQVLAGEWPPEGETLENLARTEHLRWCAYQTVAGYAPMSREEWERRAEQYRREADPGYRISRDREKRLQACLIPWEELEDLSRRENAVTGGQVDYPQMDRNNILILSRVLKARKEAERKPHGSVSV